DRHRRWPNAGDYQEQPDPESRANNQCSRHGAATSVSADARNRSGTTSRPIWLNQESEIPQQRTTTPRTTWPSALAYTSRYLRLSTMRPSAVAAVHAEMTRTAVLRR